MIKISDVKLETTYSWCNIVQLKDWNTIRICNPNWNSITMTAITNAQVKVEVTVIENTWELVKDIYPDWKIVSELPNWVALKII